MGTHSTNQPISEAVRLALGQVELAGRLTIPAEPIGMVMYAHGGGSSSRSPRNRFVVGVLSRAGLGTLSFDLCTPTEAAERARGFDMNLLAHRLIEVTRWVSVHDHVAGLPVGYFGAGAGVGAALVAAADRSVDIAAVATRGDRPDLAGIALGAVRAPTLFIVGGDDHIGLESSRRAQAAMPGETMIAIVPGATHLFPEPGALSAVADLAGDWFVGRFGADTAEKRTAATR